MRRRIRTGKPPRCGERRGPESWGAADSITLVRIAASALLLVLPWRSAAFFAVYTVAGLSDALDGWVARKTGTASDFGARLDTLAETVFAVACMIRLLPVLDIPAWLWLWIGAIALIKVINLLSGLILQRKLVAKHTLLNKVTGLALFLLPLTLPFADLRYTGSFVCALAALAAVQEGHLIRTENRP